MMRWRSLLSLKTTVIVAFVVIWNVGFLVAMSLGNGFFEPMTQVTSAVAAACGSGFRLFRGRVGQVAQRGSGAEQKAQLFVEGILACRRSLPVPYRRQRNQRNHRAF